MLFKGFFWVALSALSIDLLLMANGVNAFWRLECEGVLGFGRIDPIISPGKPAHHNHVLFGSNGVSESSGFQELRAGDCTSCAIPQDMSAYWTPPLYFEYSNGTFEMVPLQGGLLVYYLQRNADPANYTVTAFPEGFRMVAGNNSRNIYTAGDPDHDPDQSLWGELGQTAQSDLAQRSMGFNCMNYHNHVVEGFDVNHMIRNKGFLDDNCESLRLELVFPSCWNGVDVDSEDHVSHVRYPDLVQNGNCPSGFEQRLPTLFYEIIFSTGVYKGIDGQFVLANGNRNGFGYHGDFMSGWDRQFLQAALDQCTNLSGNQRDCPVFAPSLIPQDVQDKCKLKTPVDLVHENVTGWGKGRLLSALPGNVTVEGVGSTGMLGGAEVPITTLTGSVPPTTPTLSSTTSSDIVAAQSISTTQSAQTTSATTLKFTPMTTHYTTMGTVIHELVLEEAVQYVTVGAQTTTTVYATPTSSMRNKRKSYKVRCADPAGHPDGQAN